MRRQVWLAIGIFILMFGILLITSNDAPSTGKVIVDNQVAIDGGEPPVPSKQIPTDSPKVEEIFPETINVKIVNFAYTPNPIEISVGDTVVWENMDTAGHTITSDDGVEMNSRVLAKGEKYLHKFSIAGTYEYYCKIHPYMRGKVVVK